MLATSSYLRRQNGLAARLNSEQLLFLQTSLWQCCEIDVSKQFVGALSSIELSSNRRVCVYLLDGDLLILHCTTTAAPVYKSAATLNFFVIKLHRAWFTFRFNRQPSRHIATAALRINLWLLIVAVGLCCVVASFLRRRTSNDAVINCICCSYSLVENVSGVCPECGTAIPHQQLEQIKTFSHPIAD